MQIHLYKIVALSLLISFISSMTSAKSQLNGLSAYFYLKREIFVAALYTEQPASTPSVLLNDRGQMRMELKITTESFSSRRLNNMWVEGMVVNNPESTLTAQAQNMVDFTGMIKRKLVAGDILTIDRVPGEGTIVSINDVKLGIIATPDFFSVLLRTWIGPVPLSSDFREALLQAGDVDKKLFARYENVTPTAERIAAVKSWIAPAKAPFSVENPEPASTATVSESKEAAPVISTPVAATTTAPPNNQVSDIESSKVESPKFPPPEKEEVSQVKGSPPDPDPTATKVQLAGYSPVKQKTFDNGFPEDEEDEEEEQSVSTVESLLSRQYYHSRLLERTYKNLKYPDRALARRQQGNVRLSVTIDREGKLKNIRFLEKSTCALLNDGAERAVRQSEPYAPIPKELPGEEFEFSIPIVFRL